MAITARAPRVSDFSFHFNRLRDFADLLVQRAAVASDFGELEQPCVYSLEGGKRVRAVLALAAAEAIGVEAERMGFYAAALEFVHAFSLVHDDLPLMDNDLLRRGKPTTHAKFGAAPALLAGDALLARAFGLLAEASEVAERRSALTALLSRAAVDLCRGQQLDLEATAQVSLEELKQRHSLKTGALITAAVVGPVFYLSPDEQRRFEPAFRRYGSLLGLLFQITDDILDDTSSVEALGKEPGGDRRQGTPTYSSVLGLAQARALAESAAAEAKASLAQLPLSSDFLLELADFVLRRER